MENQENGLESSQNILLANIDSVKEELLQLPNVLAVGIGIKESHGVFTGEISYRVFVTEKKSEAVLSKSKMVPSTINNIKTDVITPFVLKYRPGVCVPERRTLSQHRPLKAGIAISTTSTNYGTLGWFGTLDSDNSTVLLTNKHVLYDDNEGTDTRVLPTAQPQLGNPSKCCCCECGSDNVIGDSIVGIISTASPGVDCAIARINPAIAADIELVISNNATTEVLEVAGTAQAVVGETVRKIGARSGFTTGTVVHIGDTAVAGTDPAGTTITILPSQVLVIPATTETYQVRDDSPPSPAPPICKFAFSNSGDSGSVILNDSDQIVALLYAGDETTNSVDITFANNISNVLAAFASNGTPITLSTTPAGGRSDYKKTVPERKTIVKEEDLFNTRNPLEQIRRVNTSSQLHTLFELHHREVLALINYARPATVAWQRNQGPAYVAALARAAREENYKIPHEINNVSRKQLLLLLKKALLETGSEALKQDIIRYEKDIINSVTRGETIFELTEPLLMAGLLDHIPPNLSPTIV